MSKPPRLLILWLLAVLSPAALIAGEERTLLEKPVRVMTSSSVMIFPEPWHDAPVLARGRALPEAQSERVRAILDRALKKYPMQVLQSHLDAVYVLDELRYYGVTTSGTNSRIRVYLNIGSEKAGYTEAHIEGVFHAEFSSILLRENPEFLDEAAWEALNPPGFKYLGNGVEAVKQKKAGQRLTETLHDQGFLIEYSQSTLENDLNGFAARLFTGDPRLWTIAEKHPKIRRKLELAIEFYQHLDATLDEAFFKGLIKS